MCSPCDNSCATCNGSSGTNCLSCTGSFLLTPFSSCSVECPVENYYPLLASNLCQKCFSRCLKCKGGLESDCVSCQPEFFLFSGKCDSSCPTTHYKDSARRECLPCSSSCLTCRGPTTTDCLSCTADKVIINGFLKDFEFWNSLSAFFNLRSPISKQL